MCEVWNSRIVNYRTKPILTMCEELRCYIMRRMTKYKMVLETYIGTELAPTQQKRLDDIIKDVRYWFSVWVGDDERKVFEVQRGNKKLYVDLGHNKCTCNAWQLTGLPCVHALAAIARRGDRAESYVHPLLKLGAARATYQHCLQPVNSEEYWTKTPYVAPIPPRIKRPIGRPVQKRKKDQSEKQQSSETKAKRTFRVTCSKCGESGHNHKTCKGPPAPNRRASTRNNPRANGATTNQAAEEIHVSQSAPQEQAGASGIAQPHVPLSFHGPLATNMTTETVPQTIWNGLNAQASTRAKQPIIRPPHIMNPPISSSTPPPIQPHQTLQGISHETMSAASEGTASRMFQFIPNHGFKAPRKK
ncbi:uncharacterized protein LOC130946606 [Arachis stenosperma]|uniref:uncharacterized protein LOC130946606 n=1 Tax=Arachis stenosperma TaxID=217475 RepID=UPI0025AD7491|nr:uncharacterized protein LOC130946606 [Arachis stenosperma]